MQISEQIIEVLDYLCEKLGVTIDWTNANVLPYLNMICEKYIRYEVATSAVWLAVGVIGIVIFAVLCRNALEGCKKPKYNLDADEWLAIFFICLIGMLPFIAVIICQALDIVECCTIPEKVIFEYIQAAISKNK